MVYSTIQAVFFLCKFWNTERARFDKMFANVEIVSLIKAMVLPADQFDIAAFVTTRLYLATDADDGAIFFHSFKMTSDICLIEAGSRISRNHFCLAE